jgi:hypothetical protein
MTSATTQAQFTGEEGFVNPKYVVLGVEYAPPGTSSNVSYGQDTVTGTTNTTSASFNNETSTSTSLSSTAGIPGFLNGTETTTTSTSYGQKSGSSSSVAVSQTVSSSTGLAGYTDPSSGVNHNFDYIFVWLNPIAQYMVSGSGSNNEVEFVGYGYDLTDQNIYNDMDVLGIPVGCITGWLQANFPTTWGGTNGTCADIASVYARTWAMNNVDGSIPGLTGGDLNNILAADPFATNPDYVPSVNSGYTTTDGRFTECHSTGCTTPIDFEPGLSKNYKQGYSTNTTNTQNYSHTESFAIEQKFSSSTFWNTFSLSLQTQNKMTWEYSNNSQGQTASFNIIGPSPGYDGPLQFVPFQDNYYGTFMFYP